MVQGGETSIFANREVHPFLSGADPGVAQGPGAGGEKIMNLDEIADQALAKMGMK